MRAEEQRRSSSEREEGGKKSRGLSEHRQFLLNSRRKSEAFLHATALAKGRSKRRLLCILRETKPPRATQEARISDALRGFARAATAARAVSKSKTLPMIKKRYFTVLDVDVKLSRQDAARTGS